jgi:hypothetical protein
MSVAFLFAPRSHAIAEELFFDNFEQFGNGTDLTSTNYVPAAGPSSASVHKFHRRPAALLPRSLTMITLS